MKIKSIKKAQQIIKIQQQKIKRLKKAIKMLANVLNETDYCTHYPGYTCDKDFPAECPECIIEYFMQQAAGGRK